MFFITTLLLYLLGALTYTQVTKRIVLSLAPNAPHKEKRSKIILLSIFWPLLATRLMLDRIWGR